MTSDQKLFWRFKLILYKESQSSSQRFFTSSPVKFIRIYLKSLFLHKVLLIHDNLIALFRKPKFVNLKPPSGIFFCNSVTAIRDLGLCQKNFLNIFSIWSKTLCGGFGKTEDKQVLVWPGTLSL